MGAAVIVLQDPQCHRAQQITTGTGVNSMALQEVKNADTKEKRLESVRCLNTIIMGCMLAWISLPDSDRLYCRRFAVYYSGV